MSLAMVVTRHDKRVYEIIGHFKLMLWKAFEKIISKYKIDVRQVSAIPCMIINFNRNRKMDM